MTSLLRKHCLPWNNRTFFPVDFQFSPTNASVITCHLVSGMYENEIVFDDQRNVFICSRHNEIFLFILKYLQCSLNFANSKVNFGGRLQANGTWSGVLALLNTSVADFVPHIFSLTNSREEVVYYDRLVPATDQITIISYPQAIHQQSPWILFSVFALTHWLLIALFYFLYSFLNWFSLEMERFNKNGHLELLVDRFVLSLVTIFAILLGQGTVRQVSSNRYLVFWIAFALVMRSLFANDLTAILLSQKSFNFDTFKQLYNLASIVKILIIGKSTGYYFFEENFPSLNDKLEMITFEENTSPSTLKKVVNGSCVLITTRAFGEMIQNYYLTIPFHISKEGFHSTIGNFPIRHGLNQRSKDRLSKLWQNIFQFGLENKIDKTIFISNLRASLKENLPMISPVRFESGINSSSSDKQRSTDHARVFIFIYLIGIFFAILVFAVESSTKLCSCKKSQLSCKIFNLQK